MIARRRESGIGRPRGHESCGLHPVGALAMLAPAPSTRILDCLSSFPPNLTVADLEKEYGADELWSGEVPAREGRFHDVTVLFPGSCARPARDCLARPRAETVPSAGLDPWRPESLADTVGLTPAMDLRSTETLNRRPFRLAGFSWDYAGTVISWGSGRLAPQEGSPCSVRAMFTRSGG